MRAYFCRFLSIPSQSKAVPYFAGFCVLTFKLDLLFPSEPSVEFLLAAVMAYLVAG